MRGSKTLRGQLVVLFIIFAGCTTTPGHSEPTAAPLEVRQDDLDDDERVAPEIAATVGRVLQRNSAYLGAPPIHFCRRMSVEERKACIPEVEATRESTIDGPVDIEENTELDEGGRDWPNTETVSEFRRLRLSVPLAKGERRTRHEANIVSFRSQKNGGEELCIFPLEHWSWSEMDRPERFRQAPIGICGDRELTVTEYLVEQEPDAAPVVLRFLSEPEAQAWKAHDPERIKWESPYTSGHPYAKYFLLDSLRWWRGGSAPSPNEGYAWAVRFKSLPLRRILELEKNGDVFLDVFEDGAQIELTNVTRGGLLALLAEKPAVLIDASSPEATEPRFEPFPN
ncbi:MAG: hypothetical protein P8R42_16610 [Candidatus Binatia bacterium]|nr:hypothetical protein [Candidatus Binatia bacterium]